MKDYLSEFCDLLDIKLIYRTSKQATLICGTDGEVPYIKIDEMFMYCPFEVSNAVIGYCMDMYDREVHIRILKDFIKQNSKNVRCQFNIPSKKFISLVLKKFFLLASQGRVIPSSNEMNILFVRGKNFCSNEFSVIDNDYIMVHDDDVLELEVVVSPFNT